MDTGADLNLIKLNALQDNVLVSDSNIYNMQGINDKLVNTLGSAMLMVSIGNEAYETEFQVMDSTFPITGDGILGNPFLRANQIIIDVGKRELTSKTKNISTILTRSEVIVPIQVDTQDPSEQHNVLIHTHELGKNILCGNVLNTVKINKSS